MAPRLSIQREQTALQGNPHLSEMARKIQAWANQIEQSLGKPAPVATAPAISPSVTPVIPSPTPTPTPTVLPQTVGGVNEKAGSYATGGNDNGMLIVFNDSSSCTLTLPNPPPFPTWFIGVQNINSGTLTVSPNSLDLDGSGSSISVAQNQGCVIYTDGANYFTERGLGAGVTPGGVNAQTGTSYTIISTDNSKLVTLSNTGSVAVTITAASSLGVKFYCAVENLNTGVATLTPATGTIDGAASLALGQNQGIYLFSDGSNFYTERGLGGVQLETNGTPNGSQSLLNLIAGSNITLTDGGSGGVTIVASSGGGGGGMTTLTLSGSTTTNLGVASYAATTTIAPGANHVLHIRLSGYRSATTVSIALLICKDSTHGYSIDAQLDGNLVNYYYNGTSHAISSSGAGTDDEKGPFLMDLYIPIGAVAVNGIAIGGFLNTPGSANRAWPGVTNNTQIDITGTLTIAVVIDAVANVNSLNYEIL